MFSRKLVLHVGSDTGHELILQGCSVGILNMYGASSLLPFHHTLLSFQVSGSQIPFSYALSRYVANTLPKLLLLRGIGAFLSLGASGARAILEELHMEHSQGINQKTAF